MVAVILPVHNGERYLAEAIASVLQQTHRAFRLIVVDDGSSDGSATIVRRFIARDRRVSLISQPHSGVSVARNAALAAAAGCEWIACIDHDDVMLPTRLERQLAFAAAHPGVAAFASLAFYINETGAIIGQTVPAPIRSRAELDRYLTTGLLIGLNQPSVMMRRDAVLAVGAYHPEMLVGQDLDLWMRLAQAGHLVLQQDEILTKYRMHPASATARRTYESHLTSCWVSARAAARQAGRVEPTRAEFEAAWRRRPLHERLAERRRHLGWVYYRRAGAALPNGQTAKGLAWLVAAGCLRPWYVAERMRQQLGRVAAPVSRQLVGLGD
jgi:glycosyltransferase involved in cell wall biosynthesis